MKGKFQVEILNQEQDKSHLTSDITFKSKSDIFNVSQVCNGQVGEVIGSADLCLTSSDPCVVKDTMYVKVKTVEILSATKPWLASTV